MLARPLLAVALVLPLGLAGCAGNGGGSTSPTAGAAARGPAAPHALMPPVLKVGDWWNYTAPGGALSYVVSADNGDDYTMDTDNPGLAFFNALSDVSTLGPIRKADLAGSQGSDRVAFLQWPLVDGKNWTTTWDGLPIHITAKVAGGEARMEGRRANGTLYVAYTYSNRTRWFTDLDFKDPKGESAFELKLQASGAKFPGTIKRWDLAKVVDLKGDLASPPVPASYNVPVSATDVYVTASVSCTTGLAEVGTSPAPFVGAATGTDPRGGGVGGSPCPLGDTFAGSAGAPKAPPQGGATETWGYSVTTAPGTAGSYALTILVRTLHASPVN